MNSDPYSGRRWTWLFYFLLGLYLILIIWTFRDYGVTWDEQWHSTYGEYILQWYQSHFRDWSAVNYWLLKYYGGFFDVVAQIATRGSRFGEYETRHFVSALFGLIGVAGAFKLGRYLGGPLAGFLAALFLVLTPRFYGHSFFNPKDLPFASLYLVSLYYIIQSVRYLPRIPRGLIVRLGIAIGLTLGIRIGGVLLLGYLALALCIWFLVGRHRGPETFPKQTNFRSALMTFAKGYFLVGAISYGLMLVWWPPAQVQPLLHPLKTLWKAGRFPWTRETLFEGHLVPARNVPWHYIPKWILITVPDFYFIGFAIALWLFVLALRRSPKLWNSDRFIEYSLLVVAIVFPATVAALSKAVLYDAERHVLFLFPPLAVVAALAVSRLVQQSRLRAVWVAVSAAILLSLAPTVVDMVQLHPYQYVYFNRVFGKGLKRASASFETDYWGLSYKEGVEWVVKNYSNKFPDRKIKVASCSFPFSTEYFLPKDRFIYVGSYDYKVTDHPDLFLATTRWRCHETLNGRVLHVVMREDTPLLYVKEVPEGAQPLRPY